MFRKDSARRGERDPGCAHPPDNPGPAYLRRARGAKLLRQLALVAAMTALFLVAAARDARADDTEVGGTGGGIQPIESGDIRMEAETVQAVVFGDFAEYRVDFLFDNSGAERTVKLGFPFEDLEEVGLGAPGDGTTNIAGFRAWQDGRPLRVTPQLLDPSGGEYGTQGFFLHEAVFPPGKTTITVSYLAPPLVSAGGRFTGTEWDPRPGTSSWVADYTYWLHTGAGWRDTIGKAVVRYRLADTFLGWGVDITAEQTGEESLYALTRPGGWRHPDASTYQWVFADFEPVLSPYPLRVFPGDTVDPEELATLLRGAERVTRVEIRSADEVRRERERMAASGLWDPTHGESLPAPAVRVDAYVDLVGAFSLWDALHPATRLIQDRFGGLDYDYGIDLEDPYPYDVRLSFSRPNALAPSDPPLGPRIATFSLDGEESHGSGVVPPLRVGDSVTLALEKTPHVREVRVVPGDLSRLEGYSRLARPKRIRLTFPDTTVELDLRDEPAVQRFPVDATGDGPVTLEVLDTYPGTESDEIAIWRLELGTEPAPTFTPFVELVAARPGPAVTTTTVGDDTDASTATTDRPAHGDSAPAPADSAASSGGRRAVLLWGSMAGLAVGLAGAAGGLWAWRKRPAGQS